MYKFPVTYFEQNMIFNLNNECWAAYKVLNFNYDYVSTERKISILNSLARFISNIGQEAKILVIPVSQDIDSHYRYLVRKLDERDELFDVAKAHAEGTKEYLENQTNESSVNEYVTYVITKLTLNSDVIRSIKDGLSYFFKEPKQALYEYFSVSTKDILQRKIKQFKNLAEDYLRTQSRRIEIVEATPEDIQWLIRRMFFRGLNEDIQIRYNLSEDGKIPWTPSVETFKNEKGEMVIRPYKKDVVTLSTGLIDTSENRILKINHGEKTSYQSFLPITQIPDGLEFPGNEWIIFLEEMPFETELCIHIESVEHRESLKKIDRKRQEITSQIKHIQKNNEDVPDDLMDGKDYADQLEAELKASKSPLSRVSITICLSADNKRTLDERCKQVRADFKDANFSVERPRADQEKLFMEFIPGTGRYLKDFVIPIPPRTLAGGIFGSATKLGDNEGPYIGMVGVLKNEKGEIVRAGKRIFLDILHACLRNRSASAFAWGDLGYGKSFNMNLLFYLAVMYGARGLVIDPKGERTKWLTELPELAGMVSVITLSSGQYDKGKLDPFIIYKENPDDAGELALSILAEIFKFNPKDDEYICCLEAINFVKGLENRSMTAVAERLEHFPDSDELQKTARLVARRIRNLREMGMAGLLFGDGSEKGLSFENRINILQVQNLRLPKGDMSKDDYTPEETLSTVLMIPISHFAKKFALSFPGVPKINLMDESWALSMTQQGQALFEYLSRTGRSLYTGTIFIGHSTKDVKTEGIRNALSYKFCFHITDIEEIKRSLEFMELEVTDENIGKIQALKNGQCLFRDLDGRVGKLSFDVVYEHLMTAFSTTPKKGAKVS